MGLRFIDANGLFPGCFGCNLPLLRVEKQCVIDSQISFNAGKLSGGLLGADVDLVGLQAAAKVIVARGRCGDSWNIADGFRSGRHGSGQAAFDELQFAVRVPLLIRLPGLFKQSVPCRRIAGVVRDKVGERSGGMPERERTKHGDEYSYPAGSVSDP